MQKQKMQLQEQATRMQSAIPQTSSEPILSKDSFLIVFCIISDK